MLAGSVQPRWDAALPRLLTWPSIVGLHAAGLSAGRRVWIRRLEAETACGPEGVAATKRPADEPPADGSPGAKAPRAAEDAEMCAPLPLRPPQCPIRPRE